MAAAEPPLVTVSMPGPLGYTQTWDAWITAWVRRGDGWHAELRWRENAEGVIREALLPAEFVLRRDDQNYRQVRRRTAVADNQTGRVPTGHEWRRTG